MAQEECSLSHGAEHVRQDGCEAPPLEHNVTMREQVKDTIESILGDTDPRAESAQEKLLELVEAHLHDPDRGVLEHLLQTRKTAPSKPDVPIQRGHATLNFESPDPPRTVAVPVNPEVQKRIQAILVDKLLLTAFQPVHELPAGEMVGVEALTRFVGNDGASADVWFSEASAAGLGNELEIAALHCALRAAHDLPGNLSVAFNLTPAAAIDPRVRNVLAAAPLAPDRIIVELTGSLECIESQTGHDGSGYLRSLGLRLAISASGAAFASMYQVAELRPDIIKLDRHLIEDIDTNRGQQVRARAIIGLAHQLGAHVIAEGIETVGELQEVIALHVTAARGYHLGRPPVHPLDWSAWSMMVHTEAQPAG